MSARKRDTQKAEARPSKALEQAMEAASAAMTEAGKAYAAAGLDRSARCSLAEGAMHEAGRLAEAAVRTAMAEVDKAMDRIPHHRRSDR